MYAGVLAAAGVEAKNSMEIPGAMCFCVYRRHASIGVYTLHLSTTTEQGWVVGVLHPGNI